MSLRNDLVKMAWAGAFALLLSFLLTTHSITSYQCSQGHDLLGMCGGPIPLFDSEGLQFTEILLGFAVAFIGVMVVITAVYYQKTVQNIDEL